MKLVNKSKSFIERRNLPINYNKEDKNLFHHELKKKFPSIKIYSTRNIYVHQEKMKIYKFIRFHSNFWRMSNFWLRHKFKFFIEDIKLFLKSNKTNMEDIEVIERGIWVTDQKSWKYMHWFCDALQRIEFSNEYLNEYPVILSSNYLNYHYIVSTLKLLEIPFKIVEREKKYLVKDLIITSHIAPAGNFKSDLINKISKKFKYSVIKDNNIPTNKLWISRNRSEIRKEKNFDGLSKLLEKYKYQIVYLEDYSLHEQIILVNQSHTIAGLHGAGLNNMLFLQKGANILEVRASEDAGNNCYFSLASSLGLNYYYSFAECDVEGDFYSSDYIIDLIQLEKTIKAIESV